MTKEEKLLQDSEDLSRRAQEKWDEAMSSLMNVEEKKTQLKCGLSTIYMWVREGKLRAIKQPNGRLLFYKTDKRPETMRF